MKKLIIILLAVCSMQIAQAQDNLIFNQYQVNPVLLNPAAAGFEEYHQVIMNLRNQWTGFPGAPRSYGVTYSGPVGNKIGLGAGLLSDNVGPISQIKFKLMYAFHYDINKLRMSTGFTTEFSSNNK